MVVITLVETNFDRKETENHFFELIDRVEYFLPLTAKFVHPSQLWIVKMNFYEKKLSIFAVYRLQKRALKYPWPFFCYH